MVFRNCGASGCPCVIRGSGLSAAFGAARASGGGTTQEAAARWTAASCRNGCAGADQTRPKSSMASATLVKPAMFAPTT